MRVRHTWSILILDEMLQYSTMYLYKPGSNLLENDLKSLEESQKKPNKKKSGQPSIHHYDWINEVKEEVRSPNPIGNYLILAYFTLSF